MSAKLFCLLNTEMKSGVEFSRRLTVLWRQPHTDPNPVMSTHKLTRIKQERTGDPHRGRSRQEREQSWHAVCSFIVLSFIDLVPNLLE